jgi:hypothetical protein
MATAQNRMFTSSLPVEMAAECCADFLHTLNTALDKPVERVLFVRLEASWADDLDMTAQVAVLSKVLSPRFAGDVTDAIGMVTQRKLGSTLNAIRALAKQTAQRLAGECFMPDCVREAAETIFLCSRGLRMIPGQEERHAAFASLEACLCRLVPIGRCQDAYLVYML